MRAAFTLGPQCTPAVDRPTINWLKTGLVDVDSDLLEADFELGTRRFSVIQEKGGRQLAFQMKIVSRRGVQRLGSLLDELATHRLSVTRTSITPRAKYGRIVMLFFAFNPGDKVRAA